MAATANLRPGKLNIKMTRGDTAASPILIKEGGVPADLTGRTYSCQIRRSVNTSSGVEVEVDTSQAASGIITLRLSEEITAEMNGDYMWDLEQTTNGVVRTILAGTWSFEEDITRG